MQVHAIYEDGRLTFQKPIRFKSTRIELDVTIPDNYIEEDIPAESTAVCEPVTDQQTGPHPISLTRERLNAILGPWRSKLGMPITPQEVKDIWHQHLEEKHLGSRQ